jgi:UDP-N-acetylmuramoyl-tripeptide--D-alanyl-D-alanine ligase
VTGSNGKTTAKDMCAAALSAGGLSVIKTEGTKNNHIGVPLTLLGIRAGHGAAVIELGSNHFGEIQRLTEICSPGIGIVTSIGPSHLEYFKTTRGVLREKLSLLEGLCGPRAALVNADDALLAKSAFAKSRKPFIMSVGIRRACDFRAERVSVIGAGRGVEFFTRGRRFVLAAPGYHNVYNALFACGVSRLLGLEYRDIAAGLRGFVFPPGRLNIVRVGQSTFIDDTYNASPASVREALRTLKGFKKAQDKIVVLGDMLELGARAKLLHYKAGLEAAGSCGTFIAVGPLAASALRALRRRGFPRERLFSCGTAQEARDILVRRNLLKKGTVVLVKGSRRMKMERVFRDA